MKKSLVPVALIFLALAAPALFAEELKPFSAQDKAKLEELLKNFDPATYEFRFQWVDSKGKVQNGRLGRAVGLGSVKQGETTQALPEKATQARPNCGRCQRGLGPNQTINGFKGAALGLGGGVQPPPPGPKLKLDELDALLRKYTR